jgi:hypothetical protein
MPSLELKGDVANTSTMVSSDDQKFGVFGIAPQKVKLSVRAYCHVCIHTRHSPSRFFSPSKDVQQLILWICDEGVKPKWIFVKVRATTVDNLETFAPHMLVVC